MATPALFNASGSSKWETHASISSQGEGNSEQRSLPERGPAIAPTSSTYDEVDTSAFSDALDACRVQEVLEGLDYEATLPGQGIDLGAFIGQDTTGLLASSAPPSELNHMAVAVNPLVGGMAEPQPPDFAPTRLYCPMPWPDDMLASPDRRFLWQYFLNITEVDFLCLDWEDVGHLYGFQHPYVTTLPYMALTNSALRGAILCFSAAQYQLRHDPSKFEQTRLATGTEAARAMRSHLAEARNDQGSMLSIICAATLLYAFGNEKHDYLRIASRFVEAFLSTRNRGLPWSTSYPEVTLTEYRWSVISTLCSLKSPQPPIGDDICRSIQMQEEEIDQKYSQAFQNWVSHPIYTFSPRLVNPLLRIGRLLERQLSQLSDVNSPDPNTDWESLVREAEDMLLQARERDVSAAQAVLGITDPVAVLAVNESMYATGAILLYARIHGLPFTAPFIRRQVKIVAEEISKIGAHSRVSYSIVFPLFIAGCEAADMSVRETIKERLRDPGGVAYDRGDMVGALDHIWDIRDHDPGLPWPHWVEKGASTLWNAHRRSIIADYRALKWKPDTASVA